MTELELRTAIVGEGRLWLKTPWMHHQRLRGVGTDCLGFILSVADTVGIQYSPIENYNRTPIENSLVEEFEQRFLRIESSDRQPGDVALFKFSGIPTHCGIITDIGLIHASTSRGVIEQRWETYWDKRLVAVFNPLSNPQHQSTLKA